MKQTFFILSFIQFIFILEAQELDSTMHNKDLQFKILDPIIIYPYRVTGNNVIFLSKDKSNNKIDKIEIGVVTEIDTTKQEIINFYISTLYIYYIDNKKKIVHHNWKPKYFSKEEHSPEMLKYYEYIENTVYNLSVVKVKGATKFPKRVGASIKIKLLNDNYYNEDGKRIIDEK